jgi:hypothetical protein
VNTLLSNSSLPFIAFDPGIDKGGVAWRDENGTLYAKTTLEVLHHMESFGALLTEVKPVVIAIEEIPLLSSPNAIKLGISYGSIMEACANYRLTAPDVSRVFVKPAQWQRYHGFPSGLTYKQRKKYAHRQAVHNNPGEVFTEPVSDVVLILEWVGKITSVE